MSMHQLMKKNRITFFKHLNVWIRMHASNINDLIVGGDFNCCLEDADRSTNTHLSDKSRLDMKMMIKELGIIRKFQAGWTTS